MTTEPYRKHMDTHIPSRQLMQTALLYIWGGKKEEKKKEGNPSSFAWKNTFITIKTRIKMDNFFTYTWAHTSLLCFRWSSFSIVILDIIVILFHDEDKNPANYEVSNR